MKITKASGEKVQFSEKKLRKSLQHSGAKPDHVDSIINAVKTQLYEGIHTKDIYRLAFRLLKQKSKFSAAKYKLKQALMELGPTGYPFEKFVARLLESDGYQTQTGRIVQGRCVSHEIDVIAQKDQSLHVVECKFHNLNGVFCDVKVPLYIHSRFLDVTQNWPKDSRNPIQFFQGWVVTNTRFSTDALQYGQCIGLNLVGWDYPESGSLKQRIEASGLHPITCLTTLNRTEKQALINHGIVVSKELFENQNILFQIGIRKERHKLIFTECEGLIKKSITID